MDSNVDYHIHSIFSDGTMKPSEIVKWAKSKDIMEISITDHDGIDGVHDGIIAGEALEISVIPGVELAVRFEDEKLGMATDLHMLGYKFDLKNPQLLDVIDRLKKYRKDRNERLLSVLSDMGYEISYEELLAKCPSGYVGKPVIARVMVDKGYIGSVNEAFEPGKYLESPEVKGVKREKLSAKEAIDVLAAAGGISVLAHPMKVKKLGERGSEEFYRNLDSMVRALKIAGLKGLECYHSEHTEEEALRMVELAEKYHLHITRGSDYHGEDRIVRP